MTNKNVAVHFNYDEDKKPFCVPNTKASKIVTTLDEGKVTCARCLKKMKEFPEEFEAAKVRNEELMAIDVTKGPDEEQKEHRVTRNLLDTPNSAAKYYTRHKKLKTAGGSIPVDCDDSIASKFRGVAIDDVYELTFSICCSISKDSTITVGSGKNKSVIHSVAELMKRYEHLNTGMQRMALGNIVRKYNRT